MSAAKTASKRGRLFVISAPSGCGKTTLAKRLLDDDLFLERSVSATTRKPRPGEKDGVDYRFLSEPDFREKISRGEFLEYEENFGALYGTPKSFVEDSLKKNRPVLLNIDVKGAMKVKEKLPGDSVLIFILPPSAEALEERLRQRMSEREDQIAARLKLAKKEMSHKDKYDHILVNDKLDSTYKKLKDIIISEMK